VRGARADEPWRRRHRRRSALVAAAVLLPAAGLAAAALRQDAPVAPPAPQAGEVTTHAGTTWSWVGPSFCRSGARQAVLQRVRGQGREDQPVPLVTLSALAAGPGVLVAVGRDASCAPRTVLSRDLGSSWTVAATVPAREADTAPDGAVWLVPRAANAVVLERFVAAQARPVDVGCPTDTALTHAAVPSTTTVWALCEDEPGLKRTLARSQDGGGTWEWLADELSGSGLERAGTARALSFVDERTGWIAMSGRRCPEGELRTTADGGTTWQQLPCPADTAKVGRVLDVDFVEG
jgi:hypothetical protein